MLPIINMARVSEVTLIVVSSIQQALWGLRATTLWGGFPPDSKGKEA
jgi:hypothetical protein